MECIGGASTRFRYPWQAEFVPKLQAMWMQTIEGIGSLQTVPTPTLTILQDRICQAIVASEITNENSSSNQHCMETMQDQ